MARSAEAGRTPVLLAWAALTLATGSGPAAAPRGLRIGTHGSSTGLVIECAGCHSTHSAAFRRADADPEATDWACLDCHGSDRRRSASSRSDLDERRLARAASLALLDIETEFRKPSAHPLAEGASPLVRRRENTAGFPRTAEELLAGGRASTTACTDCHDPHARDAPRAPDSTAGFGGPALVDARGRAIGEQEFCYACHGSQTSGGRESVETLFHPQNASSHPVDAPALGHGLPGLLHRSGARLSCSSCHGSDDPRGPRGPHGSRHEPILKLAYEQADGTVESPAAYALCYSCHDRATLLSPLSNFPLHASHVVEQRAACVACHDAHGSLEHDHLLSFQDGLVMANSEARLDFTEALGPGATCNLSCHGQDHVDSSY